MPTILSHPALRPKLSPEQGQAIIGVINGFGLTQEEATRRLDPREADKAAEFLDAVMTELVLVQDAITEHASREIARDLTFNLWQLIADEHARLSERRSSPGR